MRIKAPSMILAFVVRRHGMGSAAYVLTAENNFS
jgi:hypothetical protein